MSENTADSACEFFPGTGDGVDLLWDFIGTIRLPIRIKEWNADEADRAGGR